MFGTLITWVAALCIVMHSVAYAAESYPTRPIRLIVPFSAGGAADIIARLLGTGMSRDLNTQIVIDTRPGAGTVLGTEIAARANPDGYTLVLVATAHATNPGLVGKLPYDSINDFAPITLAVDTPLIFVVPAALPVGTLRELIELAKSRPQRVNNTLHRVATQTLRSPAVTEQLLAQGAEPIANTPDELRQFLKNEIDTWTSVIRQANVRPNN